MSYMEKPITNFKETKAFINGLIDENRLFHLEDNPRDIIDRSRRRIFNEEECLLLDDRLEEIFSRDLEEKAFNYILEYLDDRI